MPTSPTPDQIKRQTRDLWERSFPDDTPAFLDVYFDEKYSTDVNLTHLEAGRVVAAMQLLPYRMTIGGEALRVGYVSGLCVDEAHRGRGLAAHLLRQAHCRLRSEGGALALLIPGTEDLRRFYEKTVHGAYHTATFRHTVTVVDTGVAATDVSLVYYQSPIRSPLDELYAFYDRHRAADHALRPSKTDFRAALRSVCAEGGLVVEARRQGRPVGVCLAVKTAESRAFLPMLTAPDEGVKNLIVRETKRRLSVDQVYMKLPCVATSAASRPYAMARVVDAGRFLTAMARLHPDLDLVIGIDADHDVAQTERTFHIHHGCADHTTASPTQVFTPGSLAAHFLAAGPVSMELMLDE